MATNRRCLKTIGQSAIIFSLVFGLLAPLTVIHAASPLENIRTDSWVYEAVDFLKLAGLLHSVPSSSRPWTRAYAAQLVSEALFVADYEPPAGMVARELSA